MKNTEIPKYLYHATSQGNLISILSAKVLVPIGKRINGYDEDTISLSDILNDYVIHYGDVVIEFKAKNLFKNNEIYPYNYGIEENNPEFYDMPFWESEWRAKEVKFDYKDINEIYFIDCAPLLFITRLIRDNKIRIKIISEKDLPSFPETYYIEKYKERLRIGKNIKEKIK